MTEIDNAALRGSRVLVVEDDYLLAEDLCRDLRESGATVLGPAPTVHYAYNLLLGRRGVDGAVLDVRLHGRNVFELAARLRELDIPMLFATGHQQDIPAEFGNEARLVKPLRTDELIDKLGHLVRREECRPAGGAPPSPAAEPPLPMDARIGRCVTRALRLRFSE
jgi:DNA-binding response OmpR family regulator